MLIISWVHKPAMLINKVLFHGIVMGLMLAPWILSYDSHWCFMGISCFFHSRICVTSMVLWNFHGFFIGNWQSMKTLVSINFLWEFHGAWSSHEIILMWKPWMFNGTHSLNFVAFNVIHGFWVQFHWQKSSKFSWAISLDWCALRYHSNARVQKPPIMTGNDGYRAHRGEHHKFFHTIRIPTKTGIGELWKVELTSV